MRRTPVLIVGGGPAGSAAAITLAKAGLTPELVERSSGRHGVVCGGFLGWDALQSLRHLGVDVAALGAPPITRMRLIAGRTTVEADLPHAGAGISRPVLDAALMRAAEAAGARVRRGEAVRSADAAHRTVRLADQELACDALFLATGKHELRGAPRIAQPSRIELSVGLRASLPASAYLARALADTVELHMIDDGYAGLLLQEDGSANLCLSTSAARLNSAGGTRALLDEILQEAPILAERIGSNLSARFEAVAGVPYGWRARDVLPGVYRIGDQAAVIASLAGGGMAIALASGLSAANALLDNGPDRAGEWQRSFRRRSRLPIKLGEALRFAAGRTWLRSPLLRGITLAPSLASHAAKLTRIGSG